MLFIEYLHSFHSMVCLDVGSTQTAENDRPVQLGAYEVYMWQMLSVYWCRPLSWEKTDKPCHICNPYIYIYVYIYIYSLDDNIIYLV